MKIKTPLEKAQEAARRTDEQKFCIKNNICPNCGDELKSTWTESGTSFFGCIIWRSVNGYGRYINQVKCLHCDKIYVQLK